MPDEAFRRGKGEEEAGDARKRPGQDQGASATRADEIALWKAENREAFQQWNDWVGRNGLPLTRYRTF